MGLILTPHSAAANALLQTFAFSPHRNYKRCAFFIETITREADMKMCVFVLCDKSKYRVQIHAGSLIQTSLPPAAPAGLWVSPIHRGWKFALKLKFKA